MYWVPIMMAMALPFVSSAEARNRMNTANGSILVETVASGLEHPWSVAYLPDGRLLVTERPGRLRIVTQDGNLSGPLKGVPEVFTSGQGGLLDVALDPAFQRNRFVYLSYAEADKNGAASTAVARGKLDKLGLRELQVIFRQKPKVSGSKHWGSRLVFAPDRTLFITLGERFKFDPAQELSTHLGKVVRINSDGTVPEDNPFVGQQDALPEIWSYGHRNVQGAAINPETGALWVHEMGPEGGDELNVPEAGKNYGWPIVSWGDNYDGTTIPDPPTHPEFSGSVRQWTPVISPSGMTFYTADAIPGWKGSLLIGGLSSESLIRLNLKGNEVVGEERLALGVRIRDVRQSPDGAVHLLTDEKEGKILRLVIDSSTTP
ncbi:conserved exported protein of unknown function [Candidatus Filomicrobium marinum]|uniref:Glucose/Sorbosone dehydrogenase domain-containing protein n=1 Tax=Candidatus Filomicrobium marinum TaxID=1608628 RepID=A0A0D6JBY7_9HYPH|nr:PQQ-dependent sugar dehydrogenase [Candidatus Filomicrobium marinum]CFX04840.1 conserved exported protein of unknown function [Candidatus Filomicrobium marinum]CPR16134.1 conserved exported protein of unknown function [Candidatus Filomicrobium marinum]